MSIDKPPLGFWLQAASAKIFGLTPFSVFLPQALAGVLSVLLLYYLVRRHFGVVAGLLTALALAISPISVLTNRNNTIDSTLVLVMLLGAWAVMRAAESGKLRWLLLCAVFVGLASISTDAGGLPLRTRLWPALPAGRAQADPGTYWAPGPGCAAHVDHFPLLGIAVDLTLAANRPYVGSSQNNSEISLALGYNGIQRLL